MKILIIIPLLFMPIASIGYGEMLSDQITQFNRSLEQDAEQQTEALDALRNGIYENLSQAKSPAEKNNLKTQIARELEPVKEQIIATSQSDNEKIKAKSVYILRHAKGDSTVYKALQNIVLDRSLDPGKSYIVNETLLALSEMDAISDQAKDSMIDRLDKSLNDSSGLFGTWAFAVGYASIDGAVPVLINGLLSKNPIYIKASANTLKQLGVSANEALPTLQDVFQKLKNDPNTDYRVIEALEYAILSVSGETQSNRSNQASGNQSFAKVESTTPNIPSQTPESQTEAVQKPASFPWLWIGAIVVILGVAGGILIKLRRK